MKGRPSSGPERQKHLCSIMVVDPSNNPSISPASTSWMDVTCETKFKTICEIGESAINIPKIIISKYSFKSYIEQSNKKNKLNFFSNFSELSKSFPTCDTSVPNIYTVQYNTSQSTKASKCIYVETEPKDFFSATETCALYNGKIIDLKEKEVEQELGSILHRQTVQEFWTGAKKFKQNWVDGELNIF